MVIQIYKLHNYWFFYRRKKKKKTQKNMNVECAAIKFILKSCFRFLDNEPCFVLLRRIHRRKWVKKLSKNKSHGGLVSLTKHSQRSKLRETLSASLTTLPVDLLKESYFTNKLFLDFGETSGSLKTNGFLVP